MPEQFTPSEPNEEELLKTNDNTRENLFDRRNSAREENLELLENPEYVAEMQDLIKQLIDPNLSPEEKQELKDKMNEKLTPVPSLEEFDLDRDLSPEENNQDQGTWQLLHISHDELFDNLSSVFWGLLTMTGENAKDELWKFSKIEEVAPWFIENIEAIHNELELVLQLEEDSPQLDALKEDFDNLEFPINTLMADIEKGWGKEVVAQAVSEYLNTINWALARLNINKQYKNDRLV